MSRRRSDISDLTPQQIAAAIRRLSASDLQALLRLVPELRQPAAATRADAMPQDRSAADLLAGVPAVADQGPRLLFNGINGATGGPLFSAKTPHDLFAWIKGEDQQEPEIAKERRYTLWEKLKRQRGRGTLGTMAQVNALDPREAGWGIIYHPDTPADVRQALARLVEHRRVQCNRPAGGLPVEFWYDPARDREAYDFRHRHGQEHGAVNPEKLPYYLLIVGPPTQIPFRFQYSLDAQHAVGRLCFDTADEYARYVDSVLADEQPAASSTRRRQVILFAPANDPITALSEEFLARPLAAKLDGKELKCPGGDRVRFRAEQIAPQAASKDRLLQILRGQDDRPALLLTAAHGLGFPKESAQRQREDQGAIVCQEFPGSGRWAQNEAVPDRMFLAGRHLPAARLDGLIVMSFGCYSAGTPRQNDFAHLHDHVPLELAPQPFVARLPQRLLAQGALAFIGHVDRAWFYSYGWPEVGQQTDTFQSILEAILAGQPVGQALEYMQAKYLDLNNSLVDGALIDKFEQQEPVGEELTRLWTACNDARAYVLLGDPLVRLRPERMSA